MKSKQMHPMKVAAFRTGLSPHVIRIWERRYSAVTPSRSPTNRRLYSEEDIERLLLLRRATEGGYAIGQIARLSLEALRNLKIRDETVRRRGSRSMEASPNGSAPKVSLDELIDAIQRFDADALDAGLVRAAVSMSRPKMIQEIIVPLVHKVGEMWEEGTLRIAHEHLVTAAVRSFFGKLTRAFDIPESAPTMIVTTPVGQLHEVGALMVEATALSEGWRVVYLGPNLPAEEIAAAVEDNNAAAVGLSIVYPPDDSRVSEELLKLGQYLREDVTIFVGGRAAEGYRDALDEVGALGMDNLADFSKQLNALRFQRAL